MILPEKEIRAEMEKHGEPNIVTPEQTNDISSDIVPTLQLLAQRCLWKGPVAKEEEIYSWSKETIPMLCEYIKKKDFIEVRRCSDEREDSDVFSRDLIMNFIDIIEPRIPENNLRDALTKLTVSVVEAVVLSHRFNCRKLCCKKIRAEKRITNNRFRLKELLDEIEDHLLFLEEAFHLTNGFRPAPWTQLFYDVSVHLYHNHIDVSKL